ncbi:hypothetical protein [Rhizobium sp. MHM7A]|uniref:hypothetical protein n=1 Tax=Rhizobium sp. MHM7A TaxID=2583233 RepID=UPI001106B1F3|nr:hypothetical protein [Rhizobium sp. MHM7A]TLX17133.1 hypothetical protein FFR93_07430 [Rhizobium sp. MHM7A]
MNADPHKNNSAVYQDAVRDLNLIRDDVASLARAASSGDNLPYRARLIQARQLMKLVSYIHGSWTDAFCAVQRDCAAPEKPTTEAVEIVYSERLIAKLENTVETVWVNFGGRSGEAAIRAFEGDAAVLAAEMIHQSIVAYSDAYIARLSDRLAELRVESNIPTL